MSFFSVNQVQTKVALLLYRLFLLLLLPLILLLFVFRSRNNVQYRYRLLERLGFLSTGLNGVAFKKNSIVIHAASVGEVIAIKSFVESLLTQYPDKKITITCFTPTGSSQIVKLFGDRVQHCYLPLDNIFSTWLFLRKLQPQAVVFMETEIWPNLLAQCAAKKIPLLLINGRLSAKSCRHYQKISWLISPALQRFSYLLAQSQTHQENFIQLGANPLHCSVSGNIKYDISLTNAIKTKSTELSEMILGDRKVWLVASTHLGDDDIVLSAFKIIKTQFPELLLILVPRHPERFNTIAKQCIDNGFNLARRSEHKTVKARDDIWLLDSLGELVAAYSLANIVTVAGTFSKIGGHNPLEAALFKKPIVVGADMANFTEVLTQLSKANGVIQLNSLDPDTPTAISEQLAEKIISLLHDEQQQKIVGANAYQVMLANQGASERSVIKLNTILS